MSATTDTVTPQDLNGRVATLEKKIAGMPLQVKIIGPTDLKDQLELQNLQANLAAAQAEASRHLAEAFKLNEEGKVAHEAHVGALLQEWPPDGFGEKIFYFGMGVLGSGGVAFYLYGAAPAIVLWSIGVIAFGYGGYRVNKDTRNRQQHFQGKIHSSQCPPPNAAPPTSAVPSTQIPGSSPVSNVVVEPATSPVYR